MLVSVIKKEAHSISIPEITMLSMCVSLGFNIFHMSLPIKNLKCKLKLHVVTGNDRIDEIQILLSLFIILHLF